jgi:hypothetical protein
MNRPSTIVGLAAVTLALLLGCGKESKSGSSCHEEYVKLYEGIVKLLENASPSDPDIDAKMKNVLGEDYPEGCKDEGPRAANVTLEQVAGEFGPRLAKLEGKWGRDTLSGFRNPLGAGHG